MIIGTALIVLTWVLFCPVLALPTWAGIIITVVSAFLILFGMLFGVYFFNLDMKLTSRLQPVLLKLHDKKKKKRVI